MGPDISYPLPPLINSAGTHAQHKYYFLHSPFSHSPFSHSPTLKHDPKLSSGWKRYARNAANLKTRPRGCRAHAYGVFAAFVASQRDFCIGPNAGRCLLDAYLMPVLMPVSQKLLYIMKENDQTQMKFPQKTGELR